MTEIMAHEHHVLIIVDNFHGRCPLAQSFRWVKKGLNPWWTPSSSAIPRTQSTILSFALQLQNGENRQSGEDLLNPAAALLGKSSLTYRQTSKSAWRVAL
jgi:hypothetical protein